MALVGVDPNSTKKVTVGGATFTVGVVPHGLWLRLKQENIFALERAKRRAIADLTAEKIDPESAWHEWTGSDGAKHSRTWLMHRTLNDPSYAEELARIMREAVRASLRSFEGFVKPDGSPVPWTTDSVDLEGEKVPVVGRETLAWLATSGLLEPLYLEALKLNDLEASEKKD